MYSHAVVFSSCVEKNFDELVKWRTLSFLRWGHTLKQIGSSWTDLFWFNQLKKTKRKKKNSIFHVFPHQLIHFCKYLLILNFMHSLFVKQVGIGTTKDGKSCGISKKKKQAVRLIYRKCV